MLPLALDSVSYAVGGRTVLHDVSIELGAGRRSVIIGPNGAGKSVLLRICHGLLAPSAGTVRWAGSGAARQAMVFQRPIMLRRSALANVIFALAVHGVPRADRPARARTALQQVGLWQAADRPARVLSGGEQQRLALARAWALAPEVLFLDEPTASLDPGATREVEAVIDAIHACGTKIVMTTHDLGQAKRLGDEVIFLSAGRVVECAPVDAFFHRPASTEAAAFIRGELTWH